MQISDLLEKGYKLCYAETEGKSTITLIAERKNDDGKHIEATMTVEVDAVNIESIQHVYVTGLVGGTISIKPEAIDKVDDIIKDIL